MAKTAVTRSGYSVDTPKYYLIQAASLWADLEYDQLSGTFIGTRVGATAGGVKLTVDIKMRQIEVDGVLVPAVGQDQIESINCIAEGTVKEITGKILATAMLGASRAALETEAPDGYQVIEMASSITAGAYCSNIAIVGQLAGSTKPIIAVLSNAINTGGLSLETKDKGEAGVALKLEARADANDVEDISKVLKIFYPPQDVVAGSGTHPLEDTEAVSKTALDAKIAIVEALNPETYTSSTWAPLYVSLANANSISDNTGATQDQVDSALADLTAKQAALVSA